MAESKIRLLLLKEKDRTRIIHFPQEKATKIARKIFQEREEDCLYDEIEKKHQKIYEEAVAGDDNAALTFLNVRSKYEYEGIEIVYAEEL